ncbi:MAG: hypothetical protein MI922_14510 [Bacteroidales bacterium]|nr:hypothetical protein [Bacteroidales bacterium]
MKTRIFIPIIALFAALSLNAQQAKVISSNGYENCIELKNSNTRLLLVPDCGGRILYYELDGENIFYVDKEQDGFMWEPGGDTLELGGARFDIGPATLLPRRMIFHQGKWTGEITGDYSARMTSPVDPALGVRLIRDVTLDSKSSKVTFTQTIENVSDETKRYYYWGRTFAKGGGICLIPKNPHSRFKSGYVLYGPTDPPNVMFYKPEPQPNIRERDGILEVIGTPTLPKFAFDSKEGWIAYIAKNDLLFITSFEIYPEREYADILANPSSIWYFKEMVCEIEPIGPLEIIEPGAKASFTENWELYDFKFPKDKKVDLKKVKEYIY